jgi:transposase-like protein
MKYSKAKLKFRCQECKHDFKVQESTYTEYVYIIKNNMHQLKVPIKRLMRC